jgi:small subunit ribosomal protein S6
MVKEAPIYDLMLLLSENAEDEQRAKVLADVQSAITSAGGSIERDDDWGRRPLSYEIRHQPEAEYHLLQFRAPPTLIEELSHTLRITDGVLRFRVIKVRPGTPAPPSSPPPVVAAASSHGGTSAAPPSAPAAASEAPAGAATATAEADVPVEAEGVEAGGEGGGDDGDVAEPEAEGTDEA